jgi:CBS domain-containing protein
MTSIEDIMHRDVVTAAPEDTVAAVVERMSDAGVGAAVVVEKGAVRALFSERDLMNRVVREARDPASTKVIEVATEQVVTAPKDASIRKCAEALKARKARHLPVVDDGKLVGIVSARDFFELLSGRFEDLVEHLRYENQLADDQDPYDHLGGSYGR